MSQKFKKFDLITSLKNKVYLQKSKKVKVLQVYLQNFTNCLAHAII